MGSLFLVGPSSTELERSFQLCCTLIYLSVPSSTRADTVVHVAIATTKKVNEQDTKTFPKCYVGRNGKRNQQKLVTRYKNIQNVML